jgi:TetR/AcrR family transcriptional regulator, regulator of cefoperazone and chloramphenicol sensitivity
MLKKQLLHPIPEELSNTERRILDAAGEVFAEVGYRAATVRQICEKAGANVASINYHFGDKEGLYLAVLRSVPDAQSEKFPPQLGLRQNATAEEQLRSYVQSLIQRVFDPGRPGWHTKLIAREMAEPTRALDTLLEDVARPLHRELAAIVRRILGSSATDETVRLGALCVMGQCVYYHHARPVLKRLYPEQGYSPEDIVRIADYITDFSLAALREIARNKQGINHAHRKN